MTKKTQMKEMLEDIFAMGALIGLGYVILLWSTIGEALAG